MCQMQKPRVKQLAALFADIINFPRSISIYRVGEDNTAERKIQSGRSEYL